MYKFRAIFNLKSRSKYSFNGVVEYKDVKLRTEDGKVHGEMSLLIERADINLARDKAIEKIDELALLLTLVFEEGFIIEDINVMSVPTIIDEGHGKVVEICDYVQIMYN